MMSGFMQIKAKESPRGLVAIVHKNYAQKKNREQSQINLENYNEEGE